VYYLLVYDRAAGKLLDQTVYERRRDALRGRFAVEKLHRNASHNIEVVVVGAESEDDLHRTHGRYFLSLEQLADRAADVFARRA
jgi:hypothetical protein